MKVVIASDHAGYPLKEKLKNYFLNIEWIDLGPDDDQRVDYPDYADKLCVSQIEKNIPGVLVCGSGQGMAMRANKYQKIRAALCWNKQSAELSRQHNNANVLCLGSRLIDHEQALEIAKVFFETNFEGERHTHRVEKINSSI